MDLSVPDTKDLPALARERVAIGPAPAWIKECPYDPDFKANLRGPITHLLREMQAHAESRQTYIRTVLRLETMQAVQHNSQWRLEFEPQTQSLILHSIKIRRGSVETEHASLSRIQFLQRESNLEGHSIDGWITLLLLLEDVQPGDLLEWSYTLENRPRLLPDRTSLFFSLLPGVELGKYHFSILHAEQRPLRWKSSAPQFAPAITVQDQLVRWIWQEEKFCSPEPEPCTPDWCMDFPWIQVSDCPDWQTIAHGFLESWKDNGSADGLGKLIAEIKQLGPDRLAQVQAAVQLVQDRFRYLSVNLELGGQIPSSAETVIRRRYGDCKDLSFLLVQLLNGLDIPARPVLVHITARRALASLLPSPLFNHAVVEYEVGHEKRWVDVTAKSQGGGALNRPITDFGFGLPIAESTTDLARVPPSSLAASWCELKESFLLDTSGKPSYLAIVLTAKGSYAEAMRFEFENAGFDVVARNRLQVVADRFFKATRVGPLQTRDDRELNEFVLAEVFEIEGFLKQDDVHGTCLFQIQSDAAAGLLCPTPAPRRNPFAMPFPCNRVHIIEIEFTGLEALSIPHYQAEAEFFSFSRRCKGLQKFLKLTFAFSTRTESVPPAKVPVHRQAVEEAWRASGIQIRLPLGYARLRKRNDFGALPLPTRTGSTAVGSVLSNPPAIETNPISTTPEELAIHQPSEPAEKHVFVDPVEAARTQRAFSRSAQSRGSSTFSHSRRRRTNRKCVWSFLILLATILALVVAVILIKNPPLSPYGALIFLTVIPAWVWSMVLAIVGLRQCWKVPQREGSGITFSILTLVVGSFIGLVLIVGMIGGTKSVMREAEGRRGLASDAGRVASPEYHFAFHWPTPAWRQVDKRMMGRGVLLAFAHAEVPMVLNLNAQVLEPGLLDPRKHVVELDREAYQREATSYHLINEGEIIRNGLAGWQVETQGVLQGRDCYHVRWIFATNGFGYQIMLFGPAPASARIKEEAERLFRNFEVTAP